MTIKPEDSNTKLKTFLGKYMRELAASSTPWNMDHVELITKYRNELLIVPQAILKENTMTTQAEVNNSVRPEKTIMPTPYLTIMSFLVRMHGHIWTREDTDFVLKMMTQIDNRESINGKADA